VKTPVTFGAAGNDFACSPEIRRTVRLRGSHAVLSNGFAQNSRATAFLAAKPRRKISDPRADSDREESGSTLVCPALSFE